MQSTGNGNEAGELRKPEIRIPILVRESQSCMALNPLLPHGQLAEGPKSEGEGEGALNYANDLLHKTKWQVAIWQQVDAPKTEPPAGKLCNCSQPKAKARDEAESLAKNPESES